QARDERRAHAFALRLRLRGLVDDLVGAVDRVAQGDRLTHVTRARLDLVAPAVPAGRRDELDDRLDGDAARDLAGVVTAHAVGEHPQADLGLRSNRVFVVVPDLADVRDLYMREFSLETHA